MSIISASRRTDIPSYYSEWFANRLKEGYLLVRNPYNPTSVSRVTLSKETVDCIVFWTKNAKPMLENGSLEAVKQSGIPYYFQYTVTGYGGDIERFKCDSSLDEQIETFKRLHDLGNGHVIWRYDPIITTGYYNIDWHCTAFAYIAKRLQGYTDRCVISFVDFTGKVSRNMADVPVTPRTAEQTDKLLRSLADTAEHCGMEVFTCAESVPLEQYGIRHGKCIDDKYIEKVIGKPVSASKDKGQRKACGCVESIEVGIYGSCLNGCKYCYACSGLEQAKLLHSRYDANAPMLCDRLCAEDSVTERKMQSVVRNGFVVPDEPYEQFSLF